MPLSKGTSHFLSGSRPQLTDRTGRVTLLGAISSPGQHYGERPTFLEIVLHIPESGYMMRNNKKNRLYDKRPVFDEGFAYLLFRANSLMIS
jgi:hypothetical protein